MVLRVYFNENGVHSQSSDAKEILKLPRNILIGLVMKKLWKCDDTKIGKALWGVMLWWAFGKHWVGDLKQEVFIFKAVVNVVVEYERWREDKREGGRRREREQEKEWEREEEKVGVKDGEREETKRKPFQKKNPVLLNQCLWYSYHLYFEKLTILCHTQSFLLEKTSLCKPFMICLVIQNHSNINTPGPDNLDETIVKQ